ncbi:MAG: site-specific integrase [Verrucomicrobia bacterium]|nr:site-specific integrase [Verrucomicrobiota bacterium]
MKCNVMGSESEKAAGSVGSGTSTETSTGRKHDAGHYQKARDDRKRPIRGLWVRNGRFYAQLTIPEPVTGRKQVRRVPLEKAGTVAEAVKAMNKLKVQREANELPSLGRAPTFEDYSKQYFEYYETVKDAKRASTIQKERGAIDKWNEHLGHVRLNMINRALVNSFIAKRQAAGVSGRTVNLDVIAFRNVLKRGVEDGWLTTLPTQGLRPLKWTAKKRGFVSKADIDLLCASAFKPNFLGKGLAKPGETGKPLKNAREFSDYVRLMAFCGSRRNETLRLKWSDVDWERRQLTIGADGLAKNRQARVADFNSELEAHLKDMVKRRAPDSEWLFPSPQRGKRDVPSKSFTESLKLARLAAGKPNFGFHDCRHVFISYCVMSGIDYMTIARWVGHQDGGVLIGKVYGHLSNEHAQRQAQKLFFTPEIVKTQAAVA